MISARLLKPNQLFYCFLACTLGVTASFGLNCNYFARTFDNVVSDAVLASTTTVPTADDVVVVTITDAQLREFFRNSSEDRFPPEERVFVAELIESLEAKGARAVGLGKISQICHQYRRLRHL